jgi:acyl-CoA reductase-like NAD-dependent aldehyde dehydrogenase
MLSTKTIETVNPATGKVISSYETASKEEVNNQVKQPSMAFQRWQNTSIQERSELLRSLGKIMTKNKAAYAKLITEEKGKPIRQSIAEIDKCRWASNYYSDHAEAFLSDEIVSTEFYKSFVSFEPLGIVAAIMPWNFPFWQVMRFSIPALTADNTVILKHSSKTVGCAKMIVQTFEEAGFPEDVFTSVIGDHTVGEHLVESDVNAVSITGSVRAGKRVAELASGDLKKFVLELGGSDPFIVLEDADLERVAHAATKSRLINTGQSCIAAKRFIVVSKTADQFTDLFVEDTQKQVMGDPMKPKTSIGPLVSKDARDGLKKQVDDAKSKGGRVLTGGTVGEGEGYFYEPTIITNVSHYMDIVREEVFGPAAPIIVVNSEEEAIREANDSEFGLGASIWTDDIERGIHAAKKIPSGIVSINKIVKSDPRMPFGGIKNSGIVRELSHYGLKEFVNIKSIIAKETKFEEVPVE